MTDSPKGTTMRKLLGHTLPSGTELAESGRHALGCAVTLWHYVEAPNRPEILSRTGRTFGMRPTDSQTLIANRRWIKLGGNVGLIERREPPYRSGHFIALWACGLEPVMSRVEAR